MAAQLQTFRVFFFGGHVDVRAEWFSEEEGILAFYVAAREDGGVDDEVALFPRGEWKYVVRQ